MTVKEITVVHTPNGEVEHLLVRMTTGRVERLEPGDLIKAIDGRNEETPKGKAGHPGFKAIVDEIHRLHVKKSQDYGTNKDCFANIRASAELGIEPWHGAILRGMDKVQRIKSYFENGRRLANESLEDALLDLACYAIISLALYREGNAKTPFKPWHTEQAVQP